MPWRKHPYCLTSGQNSAYLRRLLNDVFPQFPLFNDLDCRISNGHVIAPMHKLLSKIVAIMFEEFTKGTNEMFKQLLYFSKYKNPKYINKPSFCLGSCDEIHATIFCDTFFRYIWNFLKTSLKLPRNSIKTPFERDLETFEPHLNLF